jgi:hypothetical protein
VVPIQVEKKCFFVRIVEDESKWGASQFSECFKCWPRPRRPKIGSKYDVKEEAEVKGEKEEKYDLYLDCLEKYPEEVMEQLMPNEYQKRKAKQIFSKLDHETSKLKHESFALAVSNQIQEKKRKSR